MATWASWLCDFLAQAWIVMVASLVGWVASGKQATPGDELGKLEHAPNPPQPGCLDSQGS